MSDDNPSHITRDELRAELKALNNRFLLYLGAAVGLIRFDLPTPITVGAISLLVLKGLAGLLFRVS